MCLGTATCWAGQKREATGGEEGDMAELGAGVPEGSTPPQMGDNGERWARQRLMERPQGHTSDRWQQAAADRMALRDSLH